MRYTFCTLFDKNYLYRGLALYRSLENTAEDFTLYILCLDQETFVLLSQLQLPKATLITLKVIEDAAVLRAKANRSLVEYYWTLASVFTDYVLCTYPSSITVAYVDSDIYFFSSPEPLYAEMGNDSVLIIKHNYPPRFQYLARRSGVYNVGVVIFRNNAQGKQCLRDWRNDCLEWCYNRTEEGRFGDQMYLDAWPTRYVGVHVLEHTGGGVAPWNVEQYFGAQKDGSSLTRPNEQLIFYHFHTFRIITETIFEYASAFYRLSSKVRNTIYLPYSQVIAECMRQVKALDSNFRYGTQRPESLFERMRGRGKLLLIYILHACGVL